MADLITHSLTFSKESLTEFFIKPLFIENDIREMVDIRTDIKNSEKLDFIDNLEKITKKFEQGTSFVASTGVTITQKTLTVSDMKAHVKQNGKAFLKWVKEALLKKGWEENDISGTLFDEIIMSIFLDGLRADLQRQIFFNDPVKETVDGSGIPTGTPDVDYNVYLGFWERIIIDVDAGIIDASQFVDINTSEFLNTVAVKQVDTETLTGTSGTADITLNGKVFLVTFNTSLTQTAADFVTTHAATILAQMNKIVVTSSGADIIFTAGIAGAPQSVSNAINVSGNLAGTVAATQVNIATGTLKDDAAQTIFRKSYEAMPPVLKAMRANGALRFMATSTIVDNYNATLESASAGSESAYNALLNGVDNLGYRKVPILEMMDWDVRIEQDFGNVRPHRLLLVIPKNLVVGLDGEDDDMNMELFYDKIEQENNWRVEYKMGTQYIHPDFIVCAYG